MKDVSNVTAIILGGGRGGRLMPLTAERSKPAVGFAGKYRLIDIPISNCLNSGIRRQFVLTQFLSASLHRHIMQTYRFDNFTNGFVEILAAEQTLGKSDWFQGTADAVRATLRHTLYYAADQVLILSGDHLYRMDYSKFISFHRQMGADITLCVQPIRFAEASEYGLVRVNEKNEVEGFTEKPQEEEIIRKFQAPPKALETLGPDSHEDFCLASMGIYIFEPHVLEELLEDNSATDFSKEIIPAALGRKKIAAYPFNGYWRDIGTIRNLYDAHISLTQPAPKFSLFDPNWPFHTHSRALPPSRVMQSVVRDSLLTQGCNINGATMNNSVIGTRSIIRKGTHLNGVVVMGADYYESEHAKPQRTPPLGIGENCHIESAIIDKNARIGDNVVICGGANMEDCRHENYWIRDGIAIVRRSAVIESGTIIGSKPDTHS